VALHPQAEAVLEVWAAGPSVTDPGFGAEQIEALRAEQRAVAAEEAMEPVARVTDVDADGVPCRLFVPETGAPAQFGGLVFVHGGGFVFGDLDTHDGQSRRLANRTGMAVLAVDYRRPPEHRFPAAPDDVDTAVHWLVANAAGFGIDPTRLAVIGDSAGGNLALVAALRNPNLFAAAVLVYPFLDPDAAAASYATESLPSLTAEECEWYWRQYAARPEDLRHPDLAPLRSDRLGTLPPTLVQVAEHDVLAGEDVELARLIRDAGCQVTTTLYPGMVHGFWRHPQAFDAAEEALAEAAAFLRATLES
jgi:acetyl esterase